MGIIKNRIQLLIFGLPVFVLLIYGVVYENPYAGRKTLLIGLAVLCVFLLVFKLLITNDLLKILLIIITMGVLITLEANSKYAINYFFHVIYFSEMIYTMMVFNRRSAMILSSLLATLSMFKFVELVITQPTSANISITLFFVAINSLILIVIFLAKTYKDENKKTRGLYNELLDAHRQLKHYSKDMKELASYEERTRIARDLHDTLGHEMTGLIMQMEISSALLEQGNQEEAKKILDDSKKSARESLTKVREIVNTLKDDSDATWTNGSIVELIDNFSRRTNIKINTNINTMENVPPDVGVTIYRVIQESLTNAVRHGKATVIDVAINYEENFIKVMIKDNGIGCKAITNGNGINGMIQRLEKLEGTIKFIDKDGFGVLCKIPSSNNR